jgi:hypothetical protein
MPDKKRTNRKPAAQSDEVARDRDFTDEDYAAGEPNRMRDVAPGRRAAPEDADEFVTDAEMEVREANSSPQDEDDV